VFLVPISPHLGKSEVCFGCNNGYKPHFYSPDHNLPKMALLNTFPLAIIAPNQDALQTESSVDPHEMVPTDHMPTDGKTHTRHQIH
jgi:hypothetical protein